MKRLLLSLCGGIAFLAVPGGSLYATDHFTAKLTAEQHIGAVTDSSGMGTATLTLTDAGLAFNITVEGLTDTITIAHFHNAAAGLNGGVVRTLTGDFTGNTASGLWTDTDSQPLTDAMIGELLAGNLYINVHTTANPGGEIRGQIGVSIPQILGFDEGDFKGGLPDAFYLAQNYPNPFNPTSTIRFDLPIASEVSLIIYDLRGREVVRLTEGTLGAGYHSRVWDARDSFGRIMPSGIFIARLVTPEYSKSIKMALLK